MFQPKWTPETPAARLSWLDIAAERASGKGSAMLICPDLYLLGETSAKTLFERSETANGEYAERVGEIAYLHDISLIYGYPERDGDNIYNAAACVSPTGVVLANHRKSKLNWGAESVLFQAGDGITIFEQFGWRIALFHDLELDGPDLTAAAKKAGADLFVVLATPQSGRPIAAEKVLATRAMENKVYLASANFADQTSGAEYSGRSAVYDPNGRTQVMAGEVPEIISEQLDPVRVTLAHRGVPYSNDRRALPEVD